MIGRLGKPFGKFSLAIRTVNLANLRPCYGVKFDLIATDFSNAKFINKTADFLIYCVKFVELKIKFKPQKRLKFR